MIRREVPRAPMSEHDGRESDPSSTPPSAQAQDEEGRGRADGATLLRVDYASAEGFVEDYRHNISHGDTVIRSTRQLQRGEALRLMIGFPGLLSPLHLEGRVSWRRDDGGEELAYGIELFCEGGDWAQLPRLVTRIEAGDSSLLASAVMRILVVEDNVHLADLIRRGLEAHLQRTGRDIAFEIHHAEDGLVALQHMRHERYDLLIVDIFMPVLDGAELIRQLRADKDREAVPIIAISAAADANKLALDAGADFFLPKPLRLNELLRTMDRLALAVDLT